MLAVILIVGIFFFHTAYADNNTSTLLNDTQKRLSNGVNFLSWIWIFLAIIAGKFMTNDVVYGAFMNLDKYLRAIRNVMKNFANFGLAAMILYSIIRYVVDKKWGGDDPKKIVIKALVAGVLIQVSWFAVGALVDLSTVATSAIAAFPAKFIGNNAMITNVQQELQTMYEKPLQTVRIVDWQIERGAPQPKADGWASCGAGDLDAMMPKYDSVSWPLIFIGMSFFKTQSYINQWTLPDDVSWWWQLIINLALKALILLAYVWCLIGLVIANLVRVLFLRLLIMASPIIVLMAAFGKGGKENAGGEWVTKYFNLPTFLDLIFKPVFFIWFIWMTLIFVSSMQQIMGGGKGIKDMAGITITTITWTNASSKIEMADVADFTINGDIFKDIAGGTRDVFVDLMLIVITLLLLWQMLKFSVEFWGWPVKAVMDKLTPMVESLGANLPIIPTPWGEKMWIKNLIDASAASTKKLLKWAHISTSWRFYQNEEKFQRMVNEKFLHIKWAWSEDDTTELKQIIRDDPDKFWSTYMEKAKKTNEWVSLANIYQLEVVKEWFDKIKHDETMMKQAFWSQARAATGNETFEEYFGKNANKLQLYKLHQNLWWNDVMPVNKTWLPKDFNEVKGNRYFYNPEL